MNGPRMRCSNGKSVMTQSARMSIMLPDFGGGGAERVIVSLANAFALRGVAITMIVGRAEGPCMAALDRDIPVIDLGVSRIIKAIRPLAQHMDATRPDAVLSALTHANLVTLAAGRLARHRPRIVVAERNSLSMLVSGGSVLKRAVKQRMVRTLYPMADLVTCVSRTMEQEFATFLGPGRADLMTIYNPVDLGRIRAMSAGKPSHDWLREKQGPVIVAAGRLTPQKDFATLLRAFALLPDAGAKLVIYGEGPLRSELESLVAGLGLSGRVSLPGFVGDLPAEIAASDLFVLSSRWEGLPGVLLEALAVGTPVVATDCPTGPDEILEGGRWGALVPVGDPPALAKAMAKTLSLPIDAPAETVLARFDPAGIVDQYLAVLLPDHFQTQVDKGDTR